MKRRFLLIMLCSFLLLPAAGWAARNSGNWRDLSPKKKDKVRRNYQRWQNLPQQDKKHLREEWDRWQSLPQDQRERLKRRYEEQLNKRRE